MVHLKLLPSKSEKYLTMRKNIIVHNNNSIYWVHSMCQKAKIILGDAHTHSGKYLYFPKYKDEEINIKKLSN